MVVAPEQIEIPKRKRGRPRKYPLDPEKEAKRAAAAAKTAMRKKAKTTEQSANIDVGLIQKSLAMSMSAKDYEKSILEMANPIALYGTTRATSNFDLRTIHFHGLNERYTKRLKEVFNNHLDAAVVPFNGKKIDRLPDSSKLPDMPEVKLREVPQGSLPQMSGVVKLGFNDDNKAEVVGVNGMRAFPIDTKTLRKGIALNTGGIPLVVKWYPYVVDGMRYLFVNVTSPKNVLPEGDFESSTESLLNVYQCSFDRNDTPLNLWNSIKLNTHFKELHFTQTKEEGLMMAVLANGCVDIWKLGSSFFGSAARYVEAVPSMTISLPVDGSKITCATFVDNCTVLVGGTYGLIGKYTIPRDKPDFVQATRLTTISSIRSKGAGGSVLLTSLDSGCYLMEKVSGPQLPLTLVEGGSTRDYVFAQRVESLEINDSFLVCDWPLAVKVITDRDPSGSQRAKIGGDGEVWSIGRETDATTGLVTVGLSNGGVKAINVSNYFGSEDRKTAPISIRLYQLNMEGEEYAIDLSYQVDVSSNLGKEGVRKNVKTDDKDIRAPREESLCSVGSGVCGGVLMAAWMNGLVVVEELLY